MQTRTRRWLLIAAASIALLAVTAIVLLAAFAIQRAEPLLIALAVVGLAMLLACTAGGYGVARLARARSRQRATRLRAVERALERLAAASRTQEELAGAGHRLIELRVEQLETQSADFIDGLASLAERQGLDFTDVVTRALASYRVAAAAHGSEVLEAIPYLDAYPDVIGDLADAELRALLRALRRVGYLRRAGSLAEELAVRTAQPADVATAQIMASELALYRGELEVDEAFSPLERPLQADVVLHLVGNALPATQSGYTLRTHYSVGAQARAGIRPIVVAHSGSGPDAHDATQQYEHDGVQYVLLGGPRRGRVPWDEWLAANVSALGEVVREVRPAVLHAHSDFMNALIALPVARAYGIPLVNETRGFWEESWLSRTARAEGWSDLGEVFRRWGVPDMYQLRVEREAAARSQSDAVVTLARVMERHIHDVAARLDLAVPTVHIVPNAVNSAGFDSTPSNHELRASIGLHPASLVVGYISSIVEYEGIDTLVRGVGVLERARSAGQPSVTALSEAAAQLGSRRVQLLVVGDGPELERLRQLATSLDVDVIFAGRVPHERVRDYYTLLDLFVVPRKRAAVTELVTPLKPFEAMAAGVPCVFSDVAALVEIAEDSGAATLFRADDPEDLALRLAELLGEEQTRDRMGEAGARWVRRERTWEANATTYLDLYRGLGLVADVSK